MSSFFRFNAASVRSTFCAVSVASLVTCVFSSCNSERPVPDASGDQDTHKVVAPNRGHVAEISSLSLAQLREKLGSLKGKPVVVDLWALW